MEIRKPKFELGQKVVDKNGNVETVIGFNGYHFDDDEYWYDVSYDEGTHIKKESFLKPYIEKSEPEKKTVWDLKDVDTYYLIFGDGNVSSERKWFDDDYENNCREIGNVFLTNEEAEFEREFRRIENEMVRLGGRRKFELEKANWYLEYRPMSGGIEAIWTTYEMIQGVIYFDSEEKAEEAVEIIGKDRIKKYIFRVEE